MPASSMFSSLGFVVTPHKWKAPENLQETVIKFFRKCSDNCILMIISLGPLQKE
jgi:hypothetical protein